MFTRLKENYYVINTDVFFNKFSQSKFVSFRINLNHQLFWDSIMLLCSQVKIT
jgi:hypothetical protein